MSNYNAFEDDFSKAVEGASLKKLSPELESLIVAFLLALWGTYDEDMRLLGVANIPREHELKRYSPTRIATDIYNYHALTEICTSIFGQHPALILKTPGFHVEELNGETLRTASHIQDSDDAEMIASRLAGIAAELGANPAVADSLFDQIQAFIEDTAAKKRGGQYDLQFMDGHGNPVTFRLNSAGSIEEMLDIIERRKNENEDESD